MVAEPICCHLNLSGVNLILNLNGSLWLGIVRHLRAICWQTLVFQESLLLVERDVFIEKNFSESCDSQPDENH